MIISYENYFFPGLNVQIMMPNALTTVSTLTLICNYHFLLTGMSAFKRWMVLVKKQGKHKISLEHPGNAKCKESNRKKKKKKAVTYEKVREASLKRLPLTKCGII
jgi:hypothetical protein